MKKLIPILIVLGLLSATNLWAQPTGRMPGVYVVDGTLSGSTPPNISGNTTVIGGTSPFVFDLYGGTTSINTLNGGLCAVQITGITASQAFPTGSAGDTSGPTYYLVERTRLPGGADWDELSWRPISSPLPLGSSQTPFPVPFLVTTPGETRIGIVTGATPFDGVSSKVISGIDPKLFPTPSEAGEVRYSPFGTSGTSSIPDLLSGTSVAGDAGYDADLIPPGWANYVVLGSTNDDAQWVFDFPDTATSQAPSSTLSHEIPDQTEIEFPIWMYNLGRFTVGGAANGCIRLEFRATSSIR